MQLVYFRYSIVYSSDVIFSGNGTDFVYLQQAVQVQEDEYVNYSNDVSQLTFKACGKKNQSH